MKAGSIQLLSLAQHFDAPTDYNAAFGWMCGYSADAAFMDDALERFTRQTRAQRAWDGRVWLALMLDPGNPPLSYVDAPGLTHLRIQESGQRPFNLLHAKVALLGFTHESTPDAWLVRLVVSTGNWTRQTLEESLDLAWRIDLTSTSLPSLDANVKLAVADVAACWSLFQSLIPHFDLRLVEHGGLGKLGVAAQSRSLLERWLARCTEEAKGLIPRFFDNRRASLLAQIPSQVRAHAGGVPRNYLAMASGYFESAPGDGSFPRVPLAIRKALLAESLLTQRAEVDLFVNPVNCQAVASIAKNRMAAEAITIRPARAPESVFGSNATRALHAKFLFGAKFRDGNVCCRSPWLYLGSGNLTGPGFTLVAGTGKGNLEAGVVFAPPDMPWHEKDAVKHGPPAIETLLPIGWDKEFDSPASLEAGEGFPDRPDAAIACPVAWLEWAPKDVGGALLEPRTIEPTAAPLRYEVLDPMGSPCPSLQNGHLWAGDRPREVTIRWLSLNGTSRQDRVPVVDECGRIAGTPLPKLSLEAARWQLADFPMPPAIDDDDDPDAPPTQGKDAAADANASASGKTSGYVIRDMMGFVEALADRQTQVLPPDWAAWCARLEQTLLQTASDPAVKAFLEMGINPLQSLRARPFRPAFAETSETQSGSDYEIMLDRIEHAWGVTGLDGLGGES